MMRRASLWIVLIFLVPACGIAETKLPPEPTIEYLPCTAMDLDGNEQGDPIEVLLPLAPGLESELWGGSWTVDETLHLGLIDVGVIDWQVACPGIGDPDLVVHEVPFVLNDLEMWSDLIADRIAASDHPGSFFQELVVDAGQHVIEIEAQTVDDAAALAEGVPIDAWSYGGPVMS